MSYIESHEELVNHPKLLDLMVALNIDKDAALGRLHRFWYWCMRYAETGVLDKHPVTRIDAQFGPGFVAAMRVAGLIDKDRYRVHDWVDYAGRYLKTRYRTNKPLYLAGIFLEYGRRDEAEKILSAAVQYKTAARITQAQMDVALGLLPPVPEHNSLTTVRLGDHPLPSLTPVKATHLSSTHPSMAQPTPATPIPPAGAEGPKEPEKHPDSPAPPPGGFDAFWALYPNTTNRKAAERSWSRIKPNPELQARILAALKAQIAGPVWAGHVAQKQVRFIPLGCNWLKDERWNDAVVPADVRPAPAGPPRGSPYRPTTPLQCLVCCYKLLKGVAMEDQGWDASNWDDAETLADHLLAAFAGDDQAAAVWLEGYAQDMERLDRKNWTLKSAAARAWDTKGERHAQQEERRGGRTAPAGAVVDEVLSRAGGPCISTGGAT